MARDRSPKYIDNSLAEQILLRAVPDSVVFKSRRRIKMPDCVFQPVRGSKSFLKMGWLGAMAAVAALVLMLSPQKMFAQADQGAIVGIVTDSTDAVIPGAQVTLTDTDTGLVLNAKSN